MPGDLPKEWQVPAAETSEKYRLGYINESTEQGSAWCEAQRGFGDWRKGLDILSGQESAKDLLTYRSQLSGHRLKTNVRVAIAGLSNIRPLWGYHAAEAFRDAALAMNKTTWALYLEGYWDQSIKEALAYAAATCTGWIRPVYARNLQGQGNIELLTYGQPCVLPVQMPVSGDWQKAYSVTLMDELPIYEAHWKFPDYQDRLSPTTSRYWYASQIRKASENNAWKRLTSWFRRREEDRLTDQYIPVRWTTINDCRINDTGYTIPMGEPRSTWYYEVPSYGSEIQGADGKPRKANENDARMYPRRRLMISSETCIMYDGPAFNWHGELDLIPFCMDKWPWEPIGFSMVHDGWELQKSIDQIDRGLMDKTNAQLDLPLAYPIDGVTKGEAESFDPMEPRSRIGYDSGAIDEPFKPAVPPEVYRVHPEVLQLRQILIEELDYLMQSRDIVELGKARALGKGTDELEALISSFGPIVKDMSRGMEASLGKLGKQVGFLELQYMTTSRLMQYVGAEGLGSQVFDYDPSTIVPSHLPDENPHGENQQVIPSRYTAMQRAMWFANQVRFFLMPHSIHETMQMQYRLMLMQLRGRGFPISAATVMESCDIPNVGKPDGNTEQERFWSEKEEEITHAARLQKIIQEEGIEEGLLNPGAPGTQPNGSTSRGGRPPSGQAAPELKQKGDGRPVVSESS